MPDRHWLVGLVLAAALSACGVKGPPRPPVKAAVTTSTATEAGDAAL